MSHHRGYVSAVVSAVLFGASSTLNKIVLENVNPTVIAGMIYFVAGGLLFIVHLTPLCNKILAKLDSPDTETTITKRDCRTLAFVILCGSIVAPLLLLNGLNQTTAINSSAS
jgi:drug/metabolite transporter (DMT)-like permease